MWPEYVPATPASTTIICETGPLVPDSLSELNVDQIAGPPPPGGRTGGTQLVQPIPETTVQHESAGRWTEEGPQAWLEFKRAREKYWGPSGREAIRFLTKDVPRWITHAPEEIDEPDLWAIVRGLQERAAGRGRTFTENSVRAYLDVLGSFLKWRGNYVVQSSEIKSQFRKKPTRTPVASPDEWERVLIRAVGEERVLLAFLWPNRRIEVRNARYWDFHIDRDPATWDARCKNGRGDVTDPDSPLTRTQSDELRWYLPWRRNLPSQFGDVLEDTGRLIARRAVVHACEVRTHRTVRVGSVLVGVSDQYLNRLLTRANERAKVRLPGHAYRRGGLTTLWERWVTDRRGDPDDVKAVAHHKHLSTTETYVKSLAQRRRLPTVARLLDPRREAR